MHVCMHMCPYEPLYVVSFKDLVKALLAPPISFHSNTLKNNCYGCWWLSTRAVYHGIVILIPQINHVV